jgi:hypothetical protein
MSKKKSAPKKKRKIGTKPVLKKKTPPKKPVRKKPTLKRKPAAKKKAAAKKTRIVGKKKVPRAAQQTTYPIAIRGSRGLDAASGGQSGDTQGLSRRQREDSESVEELAEEGQYFEAEAVSGVEDAKDPDQGEVTTSEVPEDDVPAEYTDRDDL